MVQVVERTLHGAGDEALVQPSPPSAVPAVDEVAPRVKYRADRRLGPVSPDNQIKGQLLDIFGRARFEKNCRLFARLQIHDVSIVVDFHALGEALPQNRVNIVPVAGTVGVLAAEYLTIVGDVDLTRHGTGAHTDLLAIPQGFKARPSDVVKSDPCPSHPVV